MNRPGQAIFVDTGYILALTNIRDQWHSSALRWSTQIARNPTRLLTTDFVLLEIADSLASLPQRSHSVRMIQMMQQDPQLEVVPASRHLLDAAWDLYTNRADKDWGLTDCTSFIVMQDRGLQNALTVDRHFQQAGFRALLLDE